MVSGGTADATKAVLLIILVGSALRLMLAAVLGLSVDESYTVSISRQFALSYFDHPPAHVWLVHGWSQLFGGEASWVVRLPFVLLFAGSSWLMYRLAASIAGERAGFWAVLALNLAPLFTVGTASWVLPDGPMVFFSLLAVWLMTQAVASSDRNILLWLAVGACAGLALLSKYLAVFPIAGMGVFLLTTRHRRLLATPGPWLALLGVGLLFTPVLLWNAEHGWVSLMFQGGRGLPTKLSLTRCLLAFLGQIAYLLPWTAVGLLMALVQALKRGPREDARWLFACLATGPVAFFLLAGLWTAVLPHWPAIGWLFAFPLLGEGLAQLEARGVRVARRATATGVVLLTLLAVAGSQAVSGWMGRVFAGFSEHDPTLEVFDWRGLGTALRERQLMKADRLLATVSWIDGGKVDYALGGTTPVLCLSRDPRGFAFLRDNRRFEGRTVVIVSPAQRPDWQTLAQPYFERIEPQPDIVLQRSAGPALTLKIGLGIGLKANPPERR